MTDTDLARIRAALPSMTPDEKARVAAILKAKQRGFRSNRYLDTAFPIVFPKQKQFLANTELEVLYGGAAGGGKSMSALMCAIQYCDIATYSAIILRLSYSDMVGNKSILNLANQKFAPLKEMGVRWSTKEMSFFFPAAWSPGQIHQFKLDLDGDVDRPDADTLKRMGPPPESRVAFGYAEGDNDIWRYDGWEVNTVIWEEVCQHTEFRYKFMFGRLRRVRGAEVPLRVRSTSNPGGRHGEWLKNRFVPEEYHNTAIEVRNDRTWLIEGKCDECDNGIHTDPMTGEKGECDYCDGTGENRRTFIPSMLKDNPAIDLREYRKSLKDLPPVLREQRERGNWTISEQGDFFRENWFRFYTRSGEHFKLQRPDEPDLLVSKERIIHFATVDSASKVKTWNDPTAIGIWAMDVRSKDLMLVHVFCKRLTEPEVEEQVVVISRSWNCEFALIEDASSGIGALQRIKLKGSLTVKAYSPHQGDIVARATIASIRMSEGQIYFPADRPPWFNSYAAEILAFPTGEHDDQVAMTSMAAWYADKGAIEAAAPPPRSLSQAWQMGRAA